MPWLRSLMLALLFCSTTLAADWPQWLGPRRDGTTKEKVKPWQGKLKILWRQKVGEGHSSPIVADGKVYLHTRKGKTTKEILRRFDAASGKPAWGTEYERGPYKGLFGTGPRATPTVVDGRAYTYGITGILTCFDIKNGQQIWQIDTQKELNAPEAFFGASCSPLVEGNRVFMNIGGKGQSIVAFDASGGIVLWKALNDKASYSSGIVTSAGDKRQLVFLTGENLVGLSPLNGKVFWQFPFKDKLAESSSTPVRMGNLLVGSSVTRGSVALKLNTKGATPRVKKAWFNPKLTCYFSTPIPAGKHLYMVTGMATLVSASSTLRCIDPQTGTELWHRPKVGKYHASLLRTGNGKLLMLEEAGNLVMLEPNAKAYRELCRSKICGNTWAHPAISNGRLYIRDDQELICVQLPK